MSNFFSGPARCCLLAALALPAAAVAQERLPGGRVLSFGTSLGLSAQSNPNLNEDGTDQADLVLGLSLGLIEATPIQRLEVTSNLNLQATAGGQDDIERIRSSDPNLAASYERRSRSAALGLEARLSVNEVGSLSPLDIDLDTTIDLDDLRELEELSERENLSEDATRLSFSLGGQLETGLDAPLGVTYALALSGARYSEDVDDLFEDSTRLRAGIGVSAQLSPVVQAELDLGQTFYLDDSRENRQSIDLDLSRVFATRTLALGLGVVSDGDESRTTLSFGGGIERPLGTFSADLGVTRSASSGSVIIGSFGAAYELPQGQLNADLTRRISRIDGEDGTESEERRVTSFSLGYARELTALWSLGISSRIVRTTGLTDGDSTTYAEIGGDLSRSLTRDWALSLGAQHRVRASSDGPDVNGNRVSVSLNRAMRLPF